MNGAAPARPVTRVAVGVLVRGDGAVLLADRPAGKPYAAHWEFPGGKIEDGESVEAALARELREELDLLIARSDPWVVLEHDYPHAYVRLYFRRVFDWQGTPRPVEGQRLIFLAPGAPAPTPLLPAAVPPLRWIQLPSVSLYSPGDAGGAAVAADWLEERLARGLRQVIWHEPALDGAALEQALRHCAARANAYGARLLVDARSLVRCPAAASSVDGVFLAAAELRAAAARPAAGWLGAAVRTPDDLARAAALGCDFAIAQPTGADRPAQEAAAALCQECPLPVYLETSAGLAALEHARAAGAHGLALAAAGA